MPNKAMPQANPAFWRKRVSIETDVITLLAMYGNLCLALRHPENKGESRELLMHLVREIGEELVLLGAMTPEQLKEAQRFEAEQGSREFKEGSEADRTLPGYYAIHEADRKNLLEEEGRETIRSDIATNELEAVRRDAKCCACSQPMNLSVNLNFVALNKKARWKNPTWDNLLLKLGLERIFQKISRDKSVV